MNCYKTRCGREAVARIIIHTTDPMALAVCERHAKQAEEQGREVERNQFVPPTVTTVKLDEASRQPLSPNWRDLT